MTEWIKSYVNLADHPKVHSLALELQIEVPHAIGILHLLWWFTLRFSWRNGNLKNFSDELIAKACHWQKTPTTLIAALKKAHFLDDYKIHDWHDFAGRLVKDRLRYLEADKIRTHYVRKRADNVRERAVNVAKSRVVQSSVETSRASPVLAAEKKTNNTPNGLLVGHYKILKGFAEDDKAWDKEFWGRSAKASAKILEAVGGLEAGISFMAHHAKKLDDKSLDWTIETIAKRAIEWKSRRNHKDENNRRQRVFSAEADRQRTQRAEPERSKVTTGEILDTVGSVADTQKKSGTLESESRGSSSRDDGKVVD